MNGRERIARALRGEWPDTVPIMLHNFMMAARESGVTMRRFRSDPEALAGSFIQAVERYEYDGIVIDVDTVTLARAIGVPVDSPEDEPARTRGGLLAGLEQVSDLTPVDLLNSSGVQVWLEGVRLLKRHFGDEVFIRGNCDQCPFTLASLVRGMDGWLMDLLDPEKEKFVSALLEYCASVTLQFIRLMAETGADMTSNGDSVAGPELVSPSIFKRFALPHDRRMAEASHALGLPYILHICGNTSAILEEMIATGADGLDIDYKTDPSLAHDRTKDRTVFVGNIDPSGVLALGTPRLVEEKTLELLRIFADTPRFILNAGCAIPSMTPRANLEAMIRTARNFGG
jgi:MtaA/CmuA family methyltransferase